MTTSLEIARGRAAYEYYYDNVFPKWVQMPAWDSLTSAGQEFWIHMIQSVLRFHD